MKELIHWENTNNQLPIELTVGLPALNAKQIIWLPLESLRLQIELNFGWELIIMEEDGVSEEIIKSFVGNFPNCQFDVYGR